jgi:phosphoribosylformimino-5-aminoimidazole carboxamide ribotide isomerase
MKEFEIIPAIDIIDGKCVRLIQGDYTRKTIYSGTPIDVALLFEDAGIKRLHMVDLDGAASGAPNNLRVLEEIASKTNLKIDFGGGVKSESSLQSVFNAGAKFVSIGTLAVKQPKLLESWIESYGSDKIILGADVIEKKIAVQGWHETTELNVSEFLLDYKRRGITTAFCTDISKDGMLQGPSLALYSELLVELKNFNLIASGGISSLQDLDDVKNTGCSGVIIGKAIYENKISLKELKSFIEKC